MPAVAFDPVLVGETATLTSALIRARPENPPGNERRVVDILAARLAEAGIDVETAPFDDDARKDGARTLLKAVLRGADPALPPLVLLGHSDVVPADPAEWSVPPYEGVIRGERLIGRGAIDMLSMVSLETLTLVALKRAEVPLARDVVLVVAGDEEADSKGVVAALERWPELGRAWAVLTEGGTLLESYLRPGEDFAAIAVAEKGLFQFTLEAKGQSGHGSTPIDDAAPDRLVRAVARVLARAPAFTLTSPTTRQLEDIGAARGGLEGVLLGNPPLAAALARPLLDATATTRALYRDTCALTMLDGGLKRNVIPGHASATFDCRLLPGTDPHRFHDDVLALVDDPRVTLRVLDARPATASDPDHPVVQALRARIRQELPGAVSVAILSKGATDCAFFRAKGVACYGFVPVRLTGEELDSMHGKDESLRVPELEKGLARLVDVTAHLARASEKP